MSLTSLRLAALAIAAFLCATALPGTVTAQSASGDSAEGAFAAWIALYDPSELLRLENENRIDELCGNSPDMNRCYADAFAPSVVVHPLRAGPSADADLMGELLVVAVPGRGLSAFYQAASDDLSASATPVVFTPDPFTPDLWLADWGYGPYFHQTVVGRQGDWYRLPRGPWPNEVWIERPAAQGSGLAVEIVEGDIIEMDGAGYYVLTTETDALTLRPEQPADMWCEIGDPPRVAADDGARWTRAQLSDASGHLRFTLKYLKGC